MKTRTTKEHGRKNLRIISNCSFVRLKGNIIGWSGESDDFATASLPVSLHCSSLNITAASHDLEEFTG